MKLIAASLLALSLLGGITAAYAGDSDDCHSISDSVYGIWGCR